MLSNALRSKWISGVEFENASCRLIGHYKEFVEVGLARLEAHTPVGRQFEYTSHPQRTALVLVVRHVQVFPLALPVENKVELFFAALG